MGCMGHVGGVKGSVSHAAAAVRCGCCRCCCLPYRPRWLAHQQAHGGALVQHLQHLAEHLCRWCDVMRGRAHAREMHVSKEGGTGGAT